MAEEIYRNEEKPEEQIALAPFERRDNFPQKVKTELEGGVFSNDSKNKPRIEGLDTILLYKSETESTTSGTLQDDDTFTFYGEADTNYFIDMMLLVNSPAAEDMIFNFSLPSGTTYDVKVIAPQSTVSNRDESANWSLATSGTDEVMLVKGVMRVGSTAGQITFQWASAAGTATGNTTVYAGSWMMYAKLIKL